MPKKINIKQDFKEFSGTNEVEMARIPVWLALSKLYLDAELDEKDYAEIAEKIKESSYASAEWIAIDLYEVFPVLQFNLLSTAGEWEGFDEKWLVEKCNAQLELRKS